MIGIGLDPVALDGFIQSATTTTNQATKNSKEWVADAGSRYR
jgi:hypothetical protein